MGAEEALPDIEAYEAAQKVPGTNLPEEHTVNYIKAACARLVAEASVSDIPTEPQKTNAKVKRLCGVPRYMYQRQSECFCYSPGFSSWGWLGCHACLKTSGA
jgi:hypothetical protein